MWRVLAPCLFLAACAAPMADIETVCLPLVSYSQADQNKAAAELAASAPSAELPVMIRDYLALRNADRAACAGKNH